MTTYRTVIADLSGNPMDEVPSKNLQYSFTLNAPGSVSFTLKTLHSKSTPALLTEGQREIHVWRDATKVWGGFLWFANPTLNDLRIQGDGYFSKLQRREVQADQIFSNTDQLDIAWNLINYTQGRTNGNMGITRFSTALSGVTRDRTYYGWERQKIGKLLEDLSGINNGFDFEITAAKEWKTYYPRKGISTPHIFEMGKNISGLSLERDASKALTSVTAIGAGEGSATLLAVSEDTTLSAAYGLLEDSFSFKDVSMQTTLNEHATEELRTRKGTRLQPEIALQTNDPPFGDYTVGDEARIKADYGFIQLNDVFRIISIVVALSDEGREAITVFFDRGIT